MKTTKMKSLLLLATGLTVFAFAQAGDLEPAGPPAPTMVTLQEIAEKLDSVVARGGTVPKTGQTRCWDGAGTSIPCAGTGQDGDFQAGYSVDPRFTDNGDGTVTDNLTGLIWLKDANCFGPRDWTTALSGANGLTTGSCGLTDNSVAGDWRLPNIKKLESLIDFGQSFPALPPGHPFSGVQDTYWGSTTVVFSPSMAWLGRLDVGNVNLDVKSNSYYVWPVRGGQ